ncbi:Hint domain-containing protein [Aquimixticola soesokkakensis]|nr:Hint domain-containing protein [Aquimixticola soesokkakensis]
MSLDITKNHLPTQSLPVYRAGAFRVTNGVNLGDPISDASELSLDDVYGMATDALALPLTVNLSDVDNGLTIAPSSEVGTPGAQIHLDCCLTLMTPDGATVEALVVVETKGGMIEEVYLLPFAALHPLTDYALVRIDTEDARRKLAEVACVSFTRGTLITLANGLQKRIEELAIGDRVLTRNSGPQEVRWIGHQTVRASGAFAPIIIRKGALNNANDLTVSPNHRLFVYQRRDQTGTGKTELLIKARLLVNGTSVVQSDGGFVDYFQLMFDNHEIIYAEGIAAESLFVDTRVTPFLPADIRDQVELPLQGMREGAGAFELRDGLIDAFVAADLLRASSAC